MGPRFLAGVLVPLALGASTPVVSLAAGQVRWFAPGRLQTGDRIGCGSVVVTLAAPPAAGTSGTDVSWTHGGVVVEVARHADGATAVACGRPDGLAPRRAAPPYVIGQNGVGLIRGPNRLARLERLYGPAGRTASGRACRATWPSLGLEATFAGGCAAAGALRTAAVAGPRWSSLRGVAVGDPVARMRWEAPDARRVSSSGGRSVWRLAAGHGSTLLAVVRGGTVERLVCRIG